MGLQRFPAAALVLAGLGLVPGGSTRADDDPAAAAIKPEIPKPWLPMEYLIGSWKGTGAPTANRTRGWEETHAWAWKFQKGVPSGLAVELRGDKVVAKGQFGYDPASGRYRLDGTDPAGKPVAFVGGFDPTGKTLTLDREGPTTQGARQRLTLFPNSSRIRYSFKVAEQEAGAPQFKSAVEVGLTKAGESFAAGGGASDLPRCVVTGGAATLTVSYQGKTFPLCCSGCRDEFNDNPEKYIKKAALMAAAGPGKPAVKAGPSINKDDGAFDGLTDDPKPAAKTAGKDADTKPGPEAAAKPAAVAPKAAVDPARKAADLLKTGQNLEKAGKLAGALRYYRRVVKEYPDTPTAKTAAARVKALDTP